MPAKSSPIPDRAVRPHGKLSAHHRGGATESMEDYLESIADIVASQGFVRVSDVAERLDIRRASVSIMIKRLAELGYLNHVPYRGFTLTPQGAKLAARVKERHETLTEFFELLGLPDSAMKRDVEGIEHHLSGDTLRLLHRFIAFWKAHPRTSEAYARFELPPR
ncbi:MAG TPA: iron dependent repressor, metal binding and dimerization domain protein [Terrimicrobiaceae bacterium]|nr:iron dependent repressor, metal binding and dimerization domain protein [Terrimicrobiaceae bacterium]